MIAYRVACTMDIALSKDWEKFFIEEHLADVIRTGYFTHYSFQKVLSEEPSQEVTYIAEYYAPNLTSLQTYNQNAASTLKQEVIDKFAGQFTAVRTISEVIHKS